LVRSVKEECLNRMIFVGPASLRHALTQYVTYHHGERNHRGLGNRLLQPLAGHDEPYRAGLAITTPSISGIARRREIRQDADSTQPYLPIRQMSQSVSDCKACGSVKELPSIQEIASASIDYVVGRIAIKINSYSLF